MAPPSKGPRRRLNLRVPTALYVRIAIAAAQSGMTVNDWCTRTLDNATKD